MNNFAIYDIATGEIVQTCQCNDIDAARSCAGPGQDVLAIPGPISNATNFVQDADEVSPPLQPVTVQMPVRPSPECVFDFATKTWVDPRSLADLKKAKNADINTWRLAANQTRFYFEGHAIQADALSRGDIDGVNGIVTLTQSLPPDFPGAWKTELNDWVPIPDVTTWVAFYAAMVAQGQANFAHAQELKEAVIAALDAAQLDLIAW